LKLRRTIVASAAQEITKEKKVDGWQGFNVGLLAE